MADDDGALYLLDGSSLVFRAYFALPEDLATTSGTVTNAVHGFMNMVTMVLRDHRPSGMAVAFDLPTPTFRDAVVADYKANRAEMPSLLRPQFDLVHALLDSLGICRLVVEGYEADDILATLATAARDGGRPVVVVSGDRDTFQLVEDPLVSVLYTRRGLSDTVRYDEAGIEGRYGVRPVLYPLLAALRGDPSDNLAGVPGVGEKTAAKLAATYGSLDAVFAHADELTPKLRANLLASEPQVRRNAEVIPLVRDVPLPVGLEDLRLGRWDVDEARRLFAELELKGAWSRLQPLLGDDGLASPASPAAGGPTTTAGPQGHGPEGSGDVGGEPAGAGAVVPAVTLVAPGPADAPAVLQELSDGRALALWAAWEGDPGRSPLAGLAVVAVPPDDGHVAGEAPVATSDVLAAGGGPVVGGAAAATDVVTAGGGPVPVTSPGEVAPGVWLGGHLLRPGSPVLVRLAACLGPGGAPVVGHQVKEIMRALLPLGVDMVRLDLDSEVAAFLLDPAAGRRSVQELAAQVLGHERHEEPAGQLSLIGDAEVLGDAEGEGEGDVVAPAGASTGPDPAGAPSRAAEELGLLLALAVVLRRRLRAEGLARLHDEIERPLVRVLARMEVAGIAVDATELRRIADDMADECQRLQDEVHRLAGVEFNVNSTPQLREVLYGKLGLTPGKKTKTGYSTDAQTLEKLRADHPVVDTLLRYREVEKLRSTYGATLLAEVGPDGRIHATFHQTGARTGRLSSDRPNLHNIPVRTEEGMALRRAFVPAPGTRLLVADYDQIELRVIAHLAGDPGLLAAFAERRDVHRATAARVFGVAEHDVTFAQRTRAKMVSYGLAYGMEAYGLAQRLGIGTDEARAILDAYFAAFPAVAAYMAEAVSEARNRGYTETALGRRRPLPDLLSHNRGLRMAAERQAMNAAVQGLAADLFKLALVRLDGALEARAGNDPAAVGEPPAARIVLQVHDEIVVEAPAGDTAAVEALVVSVMVGVGEAVGLQVPLEVTTGWGASWADAKR